jgi:hypothetical protein
MNNKNFFSFLPKFVLPLALIGLAFVLMLPYLPPYHYVNRDSGVFLYLGQQITRGKLLYVDMWDHKGPLLFYLDALGILIAGRTGVWLIECIGLSVSIVVGYSINKQILKTGPALWGTVAWLFASSIVIGENFSEEYSLPLSFLSILFFYQAQKTGRKIYPFLIGVAAGLSLLLRPNNIGVQIVTLSVIFLFDILHRKPFDLLHHLAFSVLGVMVVLVPTMGFFAANGAFYEFIYATFLFNIFYAGDLSVSRLSVFPLFFFALGWPFWYALIGWVMIFIDRVKRNGTLPAGLTLMLLLGLPLEIFLDTLSGRPYIHYVALLLPYICLLNAVLFYHFVKFIQRKPALFARVTVIVILVSLVCFSVWSTIMLQRRIDAVITRLDENSEVVHYVEAHTVETDYVLVWGLSPAINFLSRRASPTLYAYQTIFLIDGFVTSKLEMQFLSGLKKNVPALIITDNAIPLIENFADVDEQLKDIPLSFHPLIKLFSTYVQQNYHQVCTIESWKIYARNPQP